MWLYAQRDTKAALHSALPTSHTQSWCAVEMGTVTMEDGAVLRAPVCASMPLSDSSVNRKFVSHVMHSH